jgi:phosphotriesterase-related protein
MQPHQPYVMTVQGPVDPDSLGVTLMHEHCFLDVSCHFVPPTEASLLRYVDAPLEMPMLGLLRRRPMELTIHNTRLDDEGLAIQELSRYHREGGQTIVDCTVMGIGQDPEGARRVSRATGLNIIQGTGLYVDSAQPDWARDMTIEALAELLIAQAEEGIGGTGIRAGIYGEIGTSGVPRGGRKDVRLGHFTPLEGKSLRATARAAVATGLAVSVHVDRRGRGALDIVHTMAEEGLDPSRMIMGHLDVNDVEYNLEVAATGAWIQLDTFGREYYSLSMGRIQWPTDTQRVQNICEIIAAGFISSLLVAQDISLKIDLRNYGGHGYDHFLREVVPMLLNAGVTREQLDEILVRNPRRALAVSA